MAYDRYESRSGWREPRSRQSREYGENRNWNRGWDRDDDDRGDRGLAERGWSERWDRSPSREPGGMAAGGLHDPHYSEWRRRQIDALDRDYDEYRSENQSRFENEFSNWRTTRQGKRQMLGEVREHMSVVGSDEEQVGTVDCVRGDHSILNKGDSE